MNASVYYSFLVFCIVIYDEISGVFFCCRVNLNRRDLDCECTKVKDGLEHVYAGEAKVLVTTKWEQTSLLLFRRSLFWTLEELIFNVLNKMFVEWHHSQICFTCSCHRKSGHIYIFCKIRNYCYYMLLSNSTKVERKQHKHKQQNEATKNTSY